MGIIVDPDILILGILFGLIIGVLAGFFPSRKASKLQPVEALRYE
jgi:ABC-type antimicrobial peptide transport system permease subunit